jgi:hypothetical protein
MDRIVGQVEEDDQVWLFFAGSEVTEGGTGYLMPHDGDLRQLSASAISIPEVGSWFRRLKSIGSSSLRTQLTNYLLKTRFFGTVFSPIIYSKA